MHEYIIVRLCLVCRLIHSFNWIYTKGFINKCIFRGDNGYEFTETKLKEYQIPNEYYLVRLKCRSELCITIKHLDYIIILRSLSNLHQQLSMTLRRKLGTKTKHLLLWINLIIFGIVNAEQFTDGSDGDNHQHITNEYENRRQQKVKKRKQVKNSHDIFCHCATHSCLNVYILNTSEVYIGYVITNANETEFKRIIRRSARNNFVILFHDISRYICSQMVGARKIFLASSASCKMSTTAQ